MDKMSFVQAMLHYFGKNGKDTAAFMAEMKALNDADRAWFRAALIGVGYDINP